MTGINVKFYTLGCKTNLYESDAMAELFRHAGHQVVMGKEPADICVINTCTVTGTGAQKSRQQIRRVRREHPDAVVAVTGCLTQTEGETLRDELGADVILGNKYRNQIVELTMRALSGEKIYAVENILKEDSFEEMGTVSRQGRVRANLKIEDGCNNFCAYCIIPYARGPVRSRALSEIRKEAEALGDAGYQEVVLTGIHIGSYGRDKTDGTTLADVIETVHQAEGISRIRLGSLEPVVVTEEFVQRMKKLPKLCPQFHMSLQSGCDETLKRMRRRYTAEEYRQSVLRLKEAFPDVAITTDLMVGFAGETEEEFAQSYAFCREMGFAQMHIFPYSVRKGTAAESFGGQVPEPVKQERAQKMLALATTMKEEFYQKYIGKVLPVLIEQKKGNCYHGTCANYMDVMVETEQDLTGQIVPVTMTEFKNEMLKGIM